MSAALMETGWMASGNCRTAGVEMVPVDAHGTAVAKRVCVDCPVREVCLEYALVNRIEGGVWGGESELARGRLLKARPELRFNKPREHGRESCYDAGCRIDECRAAHAAAERLRDQRRRRR